MPSCISSPGLPGEVPHDFVTRAFWCLTCGIGSLWHRLHLPYTRLPWVLARLLDSSVDINDLQELASWFLELPDCCLNGWFGKALRQQVSAPADLLPQSDGRGQPLLRALYNCKNFNIEVENKFARMQSMKKVGRGRMDLSHNLAAKHLLSEVKLAHVRELTRGRIPLDSGVTDDARALSHDES